jgi:uncharacterized membrane protein YphA (DoxX/SURF4 family)
MGKKIGFWVCTVLVALVIIPGAVMDVMGPKEVVETLQHLGYPLYFATLIGVWKLAGGLAILVPRFPLVKEWAYAGLFFDLTGAAVAHLKVGDPAFAVAFPLVATVLLVGSWFLRPESRRLPGVPHA